MLLAGNVWALVKILNLTKPTGSPSFVSDNPNIIGYTMYGTEATTQYVTLDQEVLNPGSVSNRKIRIENLGGSNVYIRLSCDFTLLIENEYEKKDFLNFIVPDSLNWVKSEVDGKYYLLDQIKEKKYVDIDIALEIREELSQEDLYEEYRNCLYKIFINVETIDANGVTLVENSQEVHLAWD